MNNPENQVVEMFLDDSELSRMLALPNKGKGRKIINPFAEATQLDAAGRPKDAERIYLELLNAHFNNGVVMAALGMNYAAAAKNGLARILLNGALERIPAFLHDFKELGITPNTEDKAKIREFLAVKKAEILNALGTCYKHENRVDDARKLFKQAQALVPPNADILNNIGTLYINEGKPDEAKKVLYQALEVDKEHAQAHWNLSLALLEEGNYKDGWPEYDYGQPAKVRMDRQYTANGALPIWNGEKGARVVVWGEQGIGDEILFASCLPDLLKDCELVVFDCHKKLHRLFANSFQGVDIYPTREDEMLTWPVSPKTGKPRYDFTHRIAVGSLPRHYRNDLSEFPGTPYLNPTRASCERWLARLQRLGTKPKVGISWIGGHKRTRVEVRSLALEQLLPILDQGRDAVDFISLQYTPCEDEIEEFEAKHGIKIHHWKEAVYSEHYDDTAGLVSNLDLVITVCTSLVHLAGSMGVPTWVLTPSRPAWRYRLDLDGMPWYNSVKLFRQKTGTVDWEPVIEDVQAEFAELVDAVK